MTAFAGLEERYVAQHDYNPRHDQDFPDVVLGHLLRHIGEWCHLEAIFSCDCWAARDAVAIARDLGLNIEARRGRPGYRLSAEAPFRRRRYVRAERVSEWPRPAREEVPGQLALVVGED